MLKDGYTWTHLAMLPIILWSLLSNSNNIHNQLFYMGHTRVYPMVISCGTYVIPYQVRIADDLLWVHPCPLELNSPFGVLGAKANLKATEAEVK